jgi:hypothetical protein
MKPENIEKLMFNICKSDVDERTKKAIIYMIENSLNIEKLIEHTND